MKKKVYKRNNQKLILEQESTDLEFHMKFQEFLKYKAASFILKEKKVKLYSAPETSDWKVSAEYIYLLDWHKYDQEEVTEYSFNVKRGQDQGQLRYQTPKYTAEQVRRIAVYEKYNRQALVGYAHRLGLRSGLGLELLGALIINKKFICNPQVARWTEDVLSEEAGLLNAECKPGNFGSVRFSNPARVVSSWRIKKIVKRLGDSQGNVNKQKFMFALTAMVRLAKLQCQIDQCGDRVMRIPTFPYWCYKSLKAMQTAFEGFSWLFYSYGWQTHENNRDRYRKHYEFTPSYVSVYPALGRATRLMRWGLMHEVRSLRVKSLNTKVANSLADKESISSKNFARYFLLEKGFLPYKVVLHDKMQNLSWEKGKTEGEIFTRDISYDESDMISDAYPFNSFPFDQFCTCIDHLLNVDHGEIYGAVRPMLNIVKLFPKMKKLKKFLASLGEVSIHDIGQVSLDNIAGLSLPKWQDKFIACPALLSHLGDLHRIEKEHPMFWKMKSESIVKILKGYRFEFHPSDHPRITEMLLTRHDVTSDYHRTAQSFWDRNYKKVNRFKSHESVPHVKISAGRYTWEKLEHDDPLQIIVGQLFNCCQHFSGAASSCVRHSVESPWSATFVLFDKEKPFSAFWCWRADDMKTLVIDSLEQLGEVLSDSRKKLFVDLCESFIGRLGIKRVVLSSTSYGVGSDFFGRNHESKHYSLYVKGDYTGYSDFHDSGYLMAKEE